MYEFKCFKNPLLQSSVCQSLKLFSHIKLQVFTVKPEHKKKNNHIIKFTFLKSVYILI